MNTNILSQYHISFDVAKFERGKELVVNMTKPTSIGFYLTVLFVANYPNFFREEVIPEINRALAGQPFDPEWALILVAFEIGPDITQFSNSNAANPVIGMPTADLKEIILAWLDWIDENNLAKYI